MRCDICNELMSHNGTGSTMVGGFFVADGHNHDDNCKKRLYRCKNGHHKLISRRNKCPKCDWKGKEECFCHTGKKVDEWPDEACAG